MMTTISEIFEEDLASELSSQTLMQPLTTAGVLAWTRLERTLGAKWE